MNVRKPLRFVEGAFVYFNHDQKCKIQYSLAGSLRIQFQTPLQTFHPFNPPPNMYVHLYFIRKCHKIFIFSNKNLSAYQDGQDYHNRISKIWVILTKTL